MNEIQNMITQQAYVPISVPTQRAVRQTSIRTAADYYVSEGTDEQTVPEKKTKPLTQDGVSALAQRYDVQHMTRNEYSSLLRELRDSGVFTQKEFSAAYGGSASAAGVVLPFGDGSTDFTALVEQCAQAAPDEYAHISEIFQEISTAETQAEPEDVEPPKTEAELEIERLAQLVKDDNRPGRKSIFDPPRSQLAAAIILNDEELQTEIAKQIWMKCYEFNDWVRRSGKPSSMLHDMPPDYTGYDIKAMLQSGNADEEFQVLSKYSGVLYRKALTGGLTETEQLMDEYNAKVNLAAQGTFNERMQAVKSSIEDGFREAGLTFDESKSYSFHLDTSTFKFTVSGGTDEENALIAEIINRSDYKCNNLFTTIHSLYSHRRENREYNPWVTDTLRYKEELLPKYGVASVSAGYSRKMKNLIPAYEWWQMDDSLRSQYGIGVNDITIKNGEIVGKTDEVNRIIKEGGYRFMRTLGDAYIALRKRYVETPEFEGAVFTFEGGEFKVNYE